MSKPKIILFDIETIPNLKVALEVWCQLGSWPGRTMKAQVTSLACVGYKYLGHKATYCLNAWDYPAWDNDVNDDERLTREIHKVMSQADAVITHNGKRFDWKYLQTKFIKYDLPPLVNIKHVDTCQLAKKHLFMFNNKLDNLGQYFVKDKKLENGGWKLWVKTHARKKTYQKLMTKYCKQDVVLLEKLFEKLRPFAGNLPNMNLHRTQKQIDDQLWVCPSCGSQDYNYDGWAHTKTKSYRRMRCKNCHSVSRFDANERNPRTVQ